jgi:hypothetical protein
MILMLFARLTLRVLTTRITVYATPMKCAGWGLIQHRKKRSKVKSNDPHFFAFVWQHNQSA